MDHVTDTLHHLQTQMWISEADRYDLFKLNEWARRHDASVSREREEKREKKPHLVLFSQANTFTFQISTLFVQANFNAHNIWKTSITKYYVYFL